MIFRALLIVIIAISAFCSCSGPKKENGPDELSREFMDLYKKRGSSAVYFFFEGNKFSADSESLAYAANKLDTVTSDLGNYRGYDLITRNKVGNSFIIISYMLLYDRQPVRFNLIYYKPDKTWIPYNISYDFDLKEELKKSTELFLLNKIYQTK